MQSIFWLVAAWASVVGLFASMFEGNPNFSVLRSMLWDSTTIIKLERQHEVSTSIPINVGNFCDWEKGSRLEVVGVSPIINGPVVLK